MPNVAQSWRRSALTHCRKSLLWQDDAPFDSDATRVARIKMLARNAGISAVARRQRAPSTPAKYAVRKHRCLPHLVCCNLRQSPWNCIAMLRESPTYPLNGRASYTPRTERSGLAGRLHTMDTLIVRGASHETEDFCYGWQCTGLDRNRIVVQTTLRNAPVKRRELSQILTNCDHRENDSPGVSFAGSRIAHGSARLRHEAELAVEYLKSHSGAPALFLVKEHQATDIPFTLAHKTLFQEVANASNCCLVTLSMPAICRKEYLLIVSCAVTLDTNTYMPSFERNHESSLTEIPHWVFADTVL